MSQLTGVNQIELVAKYSKNLDTWCFRGEAPLAHLALMSQADIFDQETNPSGLQRDLSPTHASRAYEYVRGKASREYPRAFPEVVLNVREKRVLQISPMYEENETKLVRLQFSLDKMKGDKVWVSRVDGNHRLHYAAGDERREPLLAIAPFQIHVGLTAEQERSLFVDINSNQKGMNSSHLAVMQHKLTSEEQEIRDHLDRWIARKLADDPRSPWHGLIHLGGSKKGSRQQGLTRPVNFASLQAGVKRLLSKSQYIHDLTEPKAQYALIRNYWHAVKTVFAAEWGDYKNHLLLKNIGVLSLSILGGTIIDRCIPKSRVSADAMAEYLKQARARFDWQKDTIGERSISGMAGHKAALIIASEMGKELSDEAGTSTISDLQKELLEHTE